MALEAKDLELIKDTSTIARYLQYTVDLNEPINCFIKGTDIRFETMSLEVKKNPLLIRLSLSGISIPPSKIRGILNETEERIFILSFKIQDTLIFAMGTLLEVDKTSIVIRLKKEAHKLQRRNGFRLRLSDEHHCSLSFPKSLGLEVGIDYKIRDISVGGFSIEATPDVANLFVEKEAFENIKFQFETQKAELIISVKNKSSLKTTSKFNKKIGFRFEKLPQALENEIAKAAYQYTQRIFSKRI